MMDLNLDSIESDFAKYRREQISKRNNTNKARSKRQEREIAKFLGAQRVPMSGAGMLKGDGIWNTPLGLIIYECKYSAGHNAKLGWSLRLQHDWFNKLQRDVDSMNARFGFLALTFYQQPGGIKWSPCLITDHVTEILLKPEWIEGSYEYKPATPVFAGQMSTFIYYKEVRNLFTLNRVFPCTYLLTSVGRCVILPLWALKQRIDEIGHEGGDDSTGTPSS